MSVSTTAMMSAVPSRYQGYEQVRAAKSHRPATAKVSRKS
jgi:hypothetical protein